MANQENVRKWVEALRSGEYQQGKGHLTVLDADGNKFYCCLGVACEVSGVTEPAGQVESPNTGDPILAWKGTLAYEAEHDGDDSLFFPPQEVLDWLGIDEYNPVLVLGPELGYDAEASDANDTRNMTFEQIADAIERTYLVEAA